LEPDVRVMRGMRKRAAVIGIFITLSVIVAGCAGTPKESASAANRTVAPPGEWSENTLSCGGRERAYRVYRPAGYMPGGRAVVLLHGGSQSMTGIFAPGAGAWLTWREIADREKFLLITPNGLNIVNGSGLGNTQQWNDLRRTGPASKWKGDDTGFIVAALDVVKAKYGYDASRVYVTGASNGGMMAMRLLLDRPDRFAAGAAFVATLPEDLSLAPARPAGRPLLLVNTTDDPMVPWTGGIIPGDVTPMLGAEATARRWAEFAGADRAGAKTDVPPSVTTGDDFPITRTVYPPGGDSGARVEFWKVAGAGHFMPTVRHSASPSELAVARFGRECRSFESAEVAWRFFTDTETDRRDTGR
jgi:polyhydroxybutyrate depolymerase